MMMVLTHLQGSCRSFVHQPCVPVEEVRMNVYVTLVLGAFFLLRCFQTAVNSPSIRPSKVRPRSVFRSAATRCVGTRGWMRVKSVTLASCTCTTTRAATATAPSRPACGAGEAAARACGAGETAARACGAGQAAPQACGAGEAAARACGAAEAAAPVLAARSEVQALGGRGVCAVCLCLAPAFDGVRISAFLLVYSRSEDVSEGIDVPQ